MKEVPNDRQIYISSRIWHEIFPKLQLASFIYALHDGIDLAKYGEGLQRFYFTFILVKDDDVINEPYEYFNEQEREADIAVAINYDKAFNASGIELIKLMEAAYLEGIDLIESLPLQSDFDVAAFKKDVEAIFAEDQWWELAMVA